jgi:hypothetical protein
MALTIDAAGDARASNVVEHTADLLNAGALGNISAFGVDADGELYLADYATGRILKVIGPAAAPPAPTGLRIIRP